MNDFDYEVMQKKRIASSARHRVCGSKSRYCGLPSDHLTPAQIKKRSGPVMSYAMNLPMDWNTFKSMPPDLQQSYLDGLHSRFGVGAATISRDLFELSNSGLSQYMKAKSLKPIGAKGTQLTNETRPLWENWLNPPVEVKTETVVEEAPIDEDEPEEKIDAEAELRALEEQIAAILAEPLVPTSTITMEPRVRDFEVSDLSATFTGKFDAQKFLKWVSQLPMPEGDVKIRVEVTAR